MFAIRPNISLGVISDRYAKIYGSEAMCIISEHPYNFELFEIDRINPDVLLRLENLAEFHKPLSDYLPNVYGIISTESLRLLKLLMEQSNLYINNLPECLTQPKANISGFLEGKKYPYFMGIVNVTPDSFSDGGKNYTIGNAIATAGEMLNNNVDIIDIGGESTRPGAEKVSEEEELERVIPVIEGIKSTYPDAVISIDTYKSKVAEAALKSGAAIVNDISGGTFETSMFDVVSSFDCYYILMHTLGEPATMQHNPVYNNVVIEVLSALLRQAKKASEAGIKNIILDPGIGFGKTIAHNWEIIARLEEFTQVKFPILMGVSRKSMLSLVTDLPADKRDFSSGFVEMACLINGASIIRTHDYKKIRELKKTYKALTLLND